MHMTFSVDGIPYDVKASPHLYNNEIQYLVSINGSEDVIFVFDKELGRYSAQGNNTIQVPDPLDTTVGNSLNKDSLDRMKH